MVNDDNSLKFEHIDWCSCSTAYGDKNCVCPGVDHYHILILEGHSKEEALRKALWEDELPHKVNIPVEVYKRSNKCILI